MYWCRPISFFCWFLSYSSLYIHMYIQFFNIKNLWKKVLRKNPLISKFPDKCKNNHKNLLDEQDQFYLRPHLHQVWFASNVVGKVVDLITLTILRTKKTMLMNFCIVNTPRCQILILQCKLFCLFQQSIFVCEKVKKWTV